MLRGLYSDALIILDQNVVGQANNAIKKADELGASDISSKLAKIRDASKALAKENMSTYNALK